MTTEQNFTRDWFSKPGDSVTALMARRRVDPSDLAKQFEGGMTTLRGLLDGSCPINDTHASVLADALGGTVSFWRKRQTNYEIALSDAVDRATANEADEWLKLPVPGARPKGRMSAETQRAEVQRRLAFFNVGTIRAWKSRYGRIGAETLFRTSQVLTSDQGAVLMWLRSGELAADIVATRPWSPHNLRDRMDAIRALSKVRQPERFLPKLKALCSEAGVAIVTKRTPEGCRASGACRMVAPDKAMILLSFRGLADDKFWFTVFHEIGHLLMHGEKAFVDADMESLDDAECEANDFASRCIIPESRVVEFYQLRPDRDSVVRFSVSVGVSPGLIVGQMQHRGIIRREEMNYLKRHWKWQNLVPLMD